MYPYILYPIYYTPVAIPTENIRCMESLLSGYLSPYARVYGERMNVSKDFLSSQESIHLYNQKAAVQFCFIQQYFLSYIHFYILYTLKRYLSPYIQYYTGI